MSVPSLNHISMLCAVFAWMPIKMLSMLFLVDAKALTLLLSCGGSTSTGKHNYRAGIENPGVCTFANKKATRDLGEVESSRHKWRTKQPVCLMIRMHTNVQCMNPGHSTSMAQPRSTRQVLDKHQAVRFTRSHGQASLNPSLHTGLNTPEVLGSPWERVETVAMPSGRLRAMQGTEQTLSWSLLSQTFHRLLAEILQHQLLTLIPCP